VTVCGAVRSPPRSGATPPTCHPLQRLRCAPMARRVAACRKDPSGPLGAPLSRSCFERDLMRDRDRQGISRAVVMLGTVANVAIVLVAAPIRAQVPAASCRLLEPGSELLSSASCRACHPWDVCQPVDVNYENAHDGRPSALHPTGVAIARGAFLPDGQVRCVTAMIEISPKGLIWHCPVNRLPNWLLCQRDQKRHPQVRMSLLAWSAIPGRESQAGRVPSSTLDRFASIRPPRFWL
jgi:hypothetical protein